MFCKMYLTQGVWCILTKWLEKRLVPVKKVCVCMCRQRSKGTEPKSLLRNWHSLKSDNSHTKYQKQKNLLRVNMAGCQIESECVDTNEIVTLYYLKKCHCQILVIICHTHKLTTKITFLKSFHTNSLLFL